MIVSYPFSLSEINPDVAVKFLEQGVRYVDTVELDGLVYHRYDVPSKELEDEMAKYLFVKEESVDWVTLLRESTWDAPFVAKIIKYNGLPEDGRVRTLLLKRLRSYNPKSLYVDYANICRYAPAFNERYGEEKLSAMLRKVTRDGYNLLEKLEEGVKDNKITEEEAELILYAFPCTHKPKIDVELTHHSFAKELFE